MIEGQRISDRARRVPGLALIEDAGRYCAGPMDLELRGRVALVTGVSRGIGLAVAEVLLAEGMSVLGTSRTTPERAQSITCLSICNTPMRATAQWASA